MSTVNVKLGNDTLTGVDTFKFQSADSAGTYYSFQYGTGIPGGYFVTLNVDGTDWQKIAIGAGQSIVTPTTPIKSGYVCIGWATTSSATTPNVTFPYTPTGNVKLYAVFQASILYKSTVTGLGSSSPSSVSFSSNSNLVNWNFEEVTIGSDIFCKIPTMYRKVNSSSSNQITGYTVSSWKEDSSFEPYPCFIDRNGDVKPYILIGKYMISSSTAANSVNASKVDLKPSAGLSLCRAKGTGYFPYDWQCQKLLQDLMSCKKQTINFNTGVTIADYMGIAHLDQGHWVYGINKGANNEILFAYNHEDYVATDSGGASSGTTGYHALNVNFPTTSNQEVMKLSYDTSHPFVNYPVATTSNSSYNTYYCDGYYYASGNRPVLSIVGASAASCGLFYCDVSYGWTSSLGVRLCYRPS